MSVTTWNTAPDYDEWGIDNSWNCADWIQWHKMLVQHFGKETANYIWNYSYAKSGQFSSNLNCRTFDGDFRQYVASNNLNPYANAGIFKPVLNTYGSAGEVLSGALDTITSTFGGNTFSKTVKTILGVAVAGAVIYGGFYAYNTFKKK